MKHLKKILEYCKNRKNNDFNSHRGAYQNVINQIYVQFEEIDKCDHFYADTLDSEVCIYCGCNKREVENVKELLAKNKN